MHNPTAASRIQTTTRTQLKILPYTKTLHKNINKTILQLAYSIRTRHHLKSTSTGEDSAYKPQIYVKKQQNLEPPPGIHKNREPTNSI
jgi:hypothetical protein